jgi:cell fate regulator YaaT (PSP1 superfamily)
MSAVTARLYGTCAISVFDAGDLALQVEDGVIVDTEHGPDFAEVTSTHVVEALLAKRPTPRRVLRLMGDDDRKVLMDKLVQERYAQDFCAQRCEALKIPLKLIRVTYSSDLKRATFFYTAAGRVDFRQLIKDLAHELRARVEMKQVGVRDEAKMLCGCGTCGYGLCCSTFLPGFIPVSIKMAKGQGLVLNPSKILGVCGRLKCCLAYEHHEGASQPKKALASYEDDAV